MKTRLFVILASMGLTVSGLIQFSAVPASAHIYDSHGLVACVETNPFSRAGLAWIPDHAHPLWFNEFATRFGCLGHAGVLQCRWEALYWADGTVTGPYTSHCE
jgi:hypothetical protein